MACNCGCGSSSTFTAPIFPSINTNTFGNIPLANGCCGPNAVVFVGNSFGSWPIPTVTPACCIIPPQCCGRK